MKKIMTLLFLSIGIFLAGAAHVDAATANAVEINAGTFPDNILRAYVLENIDTNKDKILQKEEAAAVTKLSFQKFMEPDDWDDEEEGEYPHYTKEDFTFDCKGLERFTNLITLEINLNGGVTDDNVEYPVKVINENFLYRLKNLKHLDICEMNLKSFDCSKFPKLESLDLARFQELEKITFKGNNSLKELWLSDSLKLSKVDVSSLGKLTNLRLQALDNIKEVQFGKKNKALKELWIDHYSNEYCKKLKSLNLSKLTGLKKLGVEYVKNLKKLDTSRNKNLRYVYVAECSKIKKFTPKKNKKLTEVSISDCKSFKTLDLSANHKLSWLQLEGKQIKTIRLSKKNKLSYFRYANAGLKKFNVKNINVKTLKDLQLYGNKLKKVNVSKYKKLQSLDVDQGVKVIGRRKKTSVYR